MSAATTMISFVAVLLFAPNVEFKLDDITLGLALPAAFTRLDPEPVDGGGEMLARWRDDANGRLATVVKAPGNTDGAFDDKSAASFFDGVERGVRLKTPEFHKISGGVRADKSKKKRLVVYDLWWKVPGAVRGARFLFFRGWSAVLVVEAPGAKPGDKIDEELRALVESFGPQAK